MISEVLASLPLASLPLASLPLGIGRLVVAGGHEIAVFRTASGVMAVAARCPHAQGPLHEGMICGDVVVCPLHLRRVNLASGEVEDWPDRIRTYRVTVVGEDVRISV